MEDPILGYVRISDDPMAQPHGGKLDSLWVPIFFFFLVLQEFCKLSQTWDLRYLIFLRMQFLQKFRFLAIFLVSGH